MNMIGRIKNEQGNMLVFTLLIFVLLAVLGLGLMTTTANTLKNTKTERDDQAAYYIAEAGLVKTRAYVYNQVSTIYSQIKADYDSIEDPKEKSKFDFEREFYDRVGNINLHGEIPTPPYENHFNEPASAEVNVAMVKGNSDVEFRITSVGKIGDIQKRTVTQSFHVSLNNTKTTTQVPVSDGNNDTRLNACYAVMAYGKVTSGSGGGGGGNFNGDIYSSSDIEINSSPTVNGRLYSTGDIKITGTPKEVKGVFSEKNIIISGGTRIDGYVVAGGNVTVQNGTIEKDILANKDILISGSWPTINGEMIANGNITVTGAHFSSAGLRAIADGNIIINKDISNVKKTIYTGTLTYSTSYNKDPVSKAEIAPLIESYKQKILSETSFNVTPTPSEKNECAIAAPDMDPVGNVFAQLPAKPSDFTTPTLPVRHNGELVIQSSDNLKFNKIQLMNDYYSGIKELAISLDKPGGVLDIAELKMGSNSSLTLNLNSNNTVYIKDLFGAQGSPNLTLNLNGGNHKLVVDSLEYHGQIKLLNAGHVEIIVKNTMNLKNSKVNMDGNTKDVSIHYAGSQAITFEGESHLKADVHVKNANVTMTASGHIYGDVLVYGKNKVTINGGASAAQQVIWAPQSEVILGGGATVNGNIIADKFNSSGGFTINAPKGDGTGGGGGIVYVPVDDYGDADRLFDQSPQLET